MAHQGQWSAFRVFRGWRRQFDPRPLRFSVEPSPYKNSNIILRQCATWFPTSTGTISDPRQVLAVDSPQRVVRHTSARFVSLTTFNQLCNAPPSRPAFISEASVHIGPGLFTAHPIRSKREKKMSCPLTAETLTSFSIENACQHPQGLGKFEQNQGVAPVTESFTPTGYDERTSAVHIRLQSHPLSKCPTSHAHIRGVERTNKNQMNLQPCLGVFHHLCLVPVPRRRLMFRVSLRH